MRLRSLPAVAAILSWAIFTVAALGQAGAPMFGGFISDSNDPISIDADMLEWTERDGQNILQYSGNVVARRGTMVIRAAMLTVFLPREGAGGGTFDRIEASGNVSVVAGAQNAVAQSAVMDMVSRSVVMSGNVTLNDGFNQMSGERLTVNLTTGGWQLEAGDGRVRTIVNPGQ